MTIVIAYVPNQRGEAALALGLRIARWRGTNVLVINTSRGLALDDPRFASKEQITALRRRLDEITDLDTELSQTIAADGAKEIIRTADKHGAELIVIGIKDRSPVGRALLGSLALEVVGGAHCPVLTVRPNALPPENQDATAAA